MIEEVFQFIQSVKISSKTDEIYYGTMVHFLQKQMKSPQLNFGLLEYA